MDARPTALRSARGLALAQAKRDAIKVIVGTKYLVPSATFNGSGYVVDTQDETCTCPDFAERGGHGRLHRCKHIWAAIYVMQLPDGSTVIVEEKRRLNYPRDWTATNRCRTLIPRLAPELLCELVDGLGLPLPPDKRGRGRPPKPVRDVLLAAALRTFEEKTAGEAVVAAENYCNLGSITMSGNVHYNTLLERFADPQYMPLLHRLVAGSAYPLIGFERKFAVDGTGFGSSVYDCYHTEKHGSKGQKRKPTKRHRWVGAKIVFGTVTHCVAAVQITEPHVAECDMMPELLRRTVGNGGHISEWLGDAAYMAWYNVKAIEDVGANAYIDWPKRVKGKTNPIIRRLYKKFRAEQDEYWLHYHQRSLAETGMSMLKTRFGHYLRSRVPHAQYAESMLRCICHNVACLIMAVQELSIEPKYWTHNPAELPLFGSMHA
jgi:transposase